MGPQRASNMWSCIEKTDGRSEAGMTLDSQAEDWRMVQPTPLQSCRLFAACICRLRGEGSPCTKSRWPFSGTSISPIIPTTSAGENPMPWVRLHGTKDYWGMAMLLKEVPELRATINLVPSLLAAVGGLHRRRPPGHASARLAAAGRRPERRRR